MNKMNLVLVALYILLIANVTAEPVSLQLLADAREHVGVVPLNESARKALINSSRIILDAWVQRETKVIHFGDVFQKNSPETVLKKIEANLTKWSDYEFHMKMVEMMEHTVDDHCSYVIPGLHSCFSVLSGLRIDKVSGTPERFVVSGRSTISELLTLSPLLKNISIGDQILEINGMSPVKYAETQRPIGMKLNKEYYLSAVLDTFSLLMGNEKPLPSQDTFTLRLRSTGPNGHNYSLTLPWLSIRQEECFSEIRKSNFSFPFKKSVESQGQGNRFNKVVTESSDKAENDMSWFPGNWKPARTMPGFLNFTRSTVDIISWYIYKPDAENMGVIRMNSFYTAQSTKSQIVAQIETLLQNELKHTKSVLFEMRENRGGTLAIVERIIQLFASSVQRMKYRSLKKNLNTKFWQSADATREYTPYSRSYLSSLETESNYSDPAPLVSSVKSLHGMAYFRPVGVITNIRCFSACDAFAALMQDNKVAIVFGEDEHTGGGGSSLWSISDLQKFAPGFLPESTYSKYSQASFNEMVRPSNEKIEDLGVRSDIQIPLREDDLDEKAEIYRPYSEIAQYLFQHGEETGKNNLSLTVVPDTIVECVVGGDVLLNVSSVGFTQIRVINEKKGILFESKNLTGSFMQTISFHHGETKPGMYEINIIGVGLTSGAQGILRRYLRVLPPFKEYAVLNSTLAWPAPKDTSLQSHVAVYSLTNSDQNYGMMSMNNTAMLKMNTTTNYAYLDTRASIFLRVKPDIPLVVSLNISYVTGNENKLTLGYKMHNVSEFEDLKTVSNSTTDVILSDFSDGHNGNKTLKNATIAASRTGEYMELYIRVMTTVGEVPPVVDIYSFTVSVN